MRFIQIRDFHDLSGHHIAAELGGWRQVAEIVHFKRQADQVRIPGADLRRELQCKAAALRDGGLRCRFRRNGS